MPELVSEHGLLSPKITESHVKYQASIDLLERSSSRNLFVERVFLLLGFGYHEHGSNEKGDLMERAFAEEPSVRNRF